MPHPSKKPIVFIVPGKQQGLMKTRQHKRAQQSWHSIVVRKLKTFVEISVSWSAAPYRNDVHDYVADDAVHEALRNVFVALPDRWKSPSYLESRHGSHITTNHTTVCNISAIVTRYCYVLRNASTIIALRRAAVAVEVEQRRRDLAAAVARVDGVVDYWNSRGPAPRLIPPLILPADPTLVNRPRKIVHT